MTHIPSWIVGLVDGEGSFHIDIFKFHKMKNGYQVRAAFSIALHKDDLKTLEKIRDFFGFGSITKHRQNSIQYRVTSLQYCIKIMKFFEKYKLQAKKYQDFVLWSQCIKKINSNEHLSPNGLREIEQIRNKMNQTSYNSRRTHLNSKFV